jgi:thiol-disulfide isomerase/thioredoxin
MDPHQPHRPRSPRASCHARRSKIDPVAALLVGLFYLAALPAWTQSAEPVAVEPPAADAAPAAAAAAEPAAAVTPDAAQPGAAAQPEVPAYWLHLSGGDHLLGRLVDSPTGDELAWQAQGFAGPFSVPSDITQEIQLSGAAPPANPPGKYCFLLAHRARLAGSLLSFDEQTVLVEVAGIGQLHLDRDQLRRMYRTDRNDSAALVYVGPQGMDGWLTTGPKDAWHTNAGQMSTDQPHSGLLRDFGGLPRACYEIEISAKGPPNFSIAFGADLPPELLRSLTAGEIPDPKPPLGAFFCETWGRTLIIKRETEHEADFVDLESELLFNTNLRLQVFIDQIKGRMIVLSDTGRLLGDLTVPDSKPPVGNAIWLTNKSGSLKLNSLRVRRWNGEVPKTVAKDEKQPHRAGVDGGVLLPTVRSFDAEKRQFMIDSGDEGLLPFSEDQLEDFFLASLSGDHEDEGAAELWSVIDRQGLQFCGKIAKVEHDTLWLDCPGIREPIGMPLATLKLLSPMRAVNKPVGEPTSPPGTTGRLEMAGMVIQGSLAAPSEGSPTCLAWQPAWSKIAAAFSPGVTGKIVYRDPPPTVVADPNQEGVQQLPNGRRVVVRVGVGGVVRQRVAPVPRQRALPPGRDVLVNGTLGQPAAQNAGENLGKYSSVVHLRSGDNVRCAVTKIDERGVTLVTASSEATFVPNDQLIALELVVDSDVQAISKTKQERLLMTPRSQRASPPTHLVRSTSGDYLRGRLLAMDDLQMEMEIRLESKTIPRTAVARIIWLHPEAVEKKEPAPPVESPAGQIRLQALDHDGKRLTMFSESFADTIISGYNEVLGQCRVDVKGIDQLFLGGAVELAAADLPFHQWKLHAAPDPLGASDDDDDEETGASSPLVGKPAPDFEIALVGGQRFRWNDYRGKIVVLDFWASWCGPCMQTLPLVDKVAQEFAAQDVCLVAVNLQETPDQIKQTLDKLQLKTTVGLDVDGAVAKKYGATAIPQTVIIGRDGNVARVFVGGSSQFDDQLRSALQSVLSGKPETTE